MRWNWRICLVFSGFMICFIVDGIFYSFGVLFPELLNEWGKGDSLTSWVGSLARGHIQLIGLVVGPLTKQFGCPIIAAVGSVLASFSLVLSAYAVNLWYLYFSYGILGGCAAGFCIHPAVIATTISFKEHRGLAVGIVTAGTGTGNFVMAEISYLLIYRLSWRACVLLCGGFVLLVLVFSYFLQPRNPSPCCFGIEVSQTDLRQLSGTAQVRADEIYDGSERRGCCTIFLAFFNVYLLTEIRFFLICVGGAVVSLGLFVPSTFIVKFARSVGVSDQQSTFLLSILGINSTLSRIICGLITDQSWGNILVVYILGMFVGGLSTIVAGYFTTFLPLAIYSSLFGVSMGCILSLRSTIVFELMGLELFHDAFGVYLLFTGVSALVGPPLFGFIYEETGDFTATFITAGATILIGMSFWCIIPAIPPLKRCFGKQPSGETGAPQTNQAPTGPQSTKLNDSPPKNN